MAAETENTLSKVDSLVEEPPKEVKKRRGSSLHADVFNMADLGKSDGSLLPREWREPLSK